MVLLGGDADGERIHHQTLPSRRQKDSFYLVQQEEGDSNLSQS